MSIPHACILGCGRSGTSIFGELFEHLSAFNYSSEPPFEDLFNYDYRKPIAVKVPRVSKHLTPDPGLPFPLEAFLKTFPEPRKLFWIVRHPLDTICSLKVGISKNWGHHPQPPDYKDWLDQPLVKQCAYHWNYLNTVGYEKVKSLVQVKKFEDLVLDPKGFAEQICQDLDLDPLELSSDLDPWIQRVQNSNNAKFVEAQTSRAYSTKDHTVRVERWRENMTEAEREMVLPLIEETAKGFGYML